MGESSMILVDCTTRNYKIEFEREDGEKIDLEIGNLLKDSVRFKMGLKKFDFFLWDEFLVLWVCFNVRVYGGEREKIVYKIFLAFMFSMKPNWGLNFR
jgi:hypothetical protein